MSDIESKQTHKLTDRQREQLLEWIAAEYKDKVILYLCKREGFPALTQPAIAYYRAQCAVELAALRAERERSAMKRGLARKEERIQRLCDHADELEVIKWQADEKTGRLWNEKAWRETLADIAAETGGRIKHVNLDNIDREVEQAVQTLVNLVEASTG